MRYTELEPGIPSERKEKLLDELSQAVDELGDFQVFLPEQTGTIPESAQRAAYEFAVAYGNCLFAGMEMETEPYMPAEVLVNVAFAAAAILRHEAEDLTRSVKRFWLLTFDKARKAREIYYWYLRLAAAYKTIRPVAATYEVRMETMLRSLSPEEQQVELQKNRFLREVSEAQKQFMWARFAIEEIAWRLRGLLEDQVNAWKNLAGEGYKEVVRPFE